MLGLFTFLKFASHVLDSQLDVFFNSMLYRLLSETDIWRFLDSMILQGVLSRTHRNDVGGNKAYCLTCNEVYNWGIAEFEIGNQ
jgi:hypothetical protein